MQGFGHWKLPCLWLWLVYSSRQKLARKKFRFDKIPVNSTSFAGVCKYQPGAVLGMPNSDISFHTMLQFLHFLLHRKKIHFGVASSLVKSPTAPDFVCFCSAASILLTLDIGCFNPISKGLSLQFEFGKRWYGWKEQK